MTDSARLCPARLGCARPGLACVDIGRHRWCVARSWTRDGDSCADGRAEHRIRLRWRQRRDSAAVSALRPTHLASLALCARVIVRSSSSSPLNEMSALVPALTALWSVARSPLSRPSAASSFYLYFLACVELAACTCWAVRRTCWLLVAFDERAHSQTALFLVFRSSMCRLGARARRPRTEYRPARCACLQSADLSPVHL